MNCSKIRELIPLIVDNKLDQEQMAMVEKHLLNCGACNKELDDHRMVSGLLKDLQEVPLPEEFDALLREKLKAVKRPAKTRNWIRYSSLAAIFLVGLFSIALYNDKDPVFDVKEQEPRLAAVMMAAPQEDATPQEEASQLEEAAPIEEMPTMMAKMAAPEDEISPYIKLLEEMYIDRHFQVIDWHLESPQVYMITIELESVTNTESVSKEAITFKGQDGTLCKIE